MIRKNQKKIIISSNTSWSIVNFRSNLIKALIKEGFDVVVIAPIDDYSESISSLGCRFINLNMDNKGKNPFKDFLLLIKYIYIFRRERPLVYLGFTIKPNIYGSIAAHILRIKVLNNIAGLGSVFISETLITKIVQYLYMVALSHSEKVFFQNLEDKRLFLEKKIVIEDQCDRLPGSGVDLDYFQLNSINRKKEQFKFLLIGRMLWEKGIGEYVNAARILKAKYPRIEFQLLGFLDVENPSSISREQMDIWTKEGVVNYIGITTDVRPFIETADCIVLPSYYREGVPRTLLEASAMGKPIITTNSVGCRDVVEDTVNGFLVKPRDAEDLTLKMEKMVSLGDTERRLMGLKGREKIEKEFDERIVLEKYMDAIKPLFDELLSFGKERF